MMHTRKIDISRLIAVIALCMPVMLCAQDSSAPAARESLLYLKYQLKNNRIPYLQVQTKSKEGKAFLPAGNVPVELFLDKDSAAEALIGKVTTNNLGEATIWIPGSLAKAWDHASDHTFYAQAKAVKNFDAVQASVTVIMARLELDTAAGSDGRSLKAKLVKKEGESWVPMPEVDVRLAVKRLGGYLPVAGDETYTTDSTGSVTGEFGLQHLPGDSTGKIEVVARVEENDEVGTLETSLLVPWWEPVVYKSDFNKRSLWATGRKAPIWLMLIAYGCIIGVWSTVIYLFINLYKIIKLRSQA